VRRFLTVVLATSTLTACGGSSPDDSAVTVFAAAALAAALTEAADAFQVTNPGTEFRFNVAGSFALANQITQGAPADVFAAADPAAMDRVAAVQPTVFATNRAAIIVAAGNPRGITALADLAQPDVVVVGCAPTAACGRLLGDVTRRADVSVAPRSLEDSVRGVVTKVTLGEADAGVVFHTDVLAAGDRAEGVPLPDDVNVVVRHTIAVTPDARNGTAAQAFVDFVLSGEGRAILAFHGFGLP
jgi:molybdate transport system substrate-binding protein